MGELGDRPLLVRQGGQEIADVLATRTQPLRLRALGQLGRWREVRPVPALTLLAAPLS